MSLEVYFNKIEGALPLLYSRLIFLALTALFFALFFLYQLLPFSFFVLVPLFYLFFRKRFSFKEGFFWGIVFYVVHSFPLLMIVYKEGCGCFRIFAPFFLFFYFSFFVGIWFKVLSYSYLFFKRELIGIVSISLCFFFIMNELVLTPFDYVEGYPFIFPLVPLSRWPFLLNGIHIFNEYGLLAMWLFVQTGMAYFIVKRHVSYCLVTIVVFFPIFEPYREKATKMHEWDKKIAFISSPEPGLGYWDSAQNICKKIIEARIQFPEIKLFVMPESAFPYSLRNDSEAVAMWVESGLSENQTLIIGSHQNENKRLRNTMFCIDKSRIILSYEKKHLVPFFERTVKNIRFLKSFDFLFLHNKEAFTQNLSPLSVYKHPELGYFLPILCSELFWRNRMGFEGIPRLCLMKTDRFEFSRWPYLFDSFGHYCSLKEKAQFLLIGSKRAYWCNTPI